MGKIKKKLMTYLVISLSKSNTQLDHQEWNHLPNEYIWILGSKINVDIVVQPRHYVVTVQNIQIKPRKQETHSRKTREFIGAETMSW